MRTGPILGQLLRQYRLDVAAISFGAYVAGLVFSGGINRSDVLVGLGISLISFNYIYSLNSIEDRHIDSINKPGRPIPAGTLPVSIARAYVALLLGLSIAYPFLVYDNPVNLALFLSLPLLGWAYSSPPLRLKTKVVPATVSIALMYVAPMAIALTSRPDSLEPMHEVLLGYIFLYSLSVVPLKDIEDVRGDQLLGSSNWLARLGLRRLLVFSVSGLAGSILLVVLSRQDFATTFVLAGLSTSTASLIAAFALFRFPPERLYRSLLGLIALLGLGFTAYFLLLGGSL